MTTRRQTKSKQDIAYEDVEDLFEVVLPGQRRLTATKTRQTNNDTGEVADYLNIREWYWSKRTESWAAKRNGMFMPWSEDVLGAFMDMSLVFQAKLLNNEAPKMAPKTGGKATATAPSKPANGAAAPKAERPKVRAGGRVSIQIPKR